jgi:hypothetical protein
MSRLAETLAPQEFGGSTFDVRKDGARLHLQLNRVRALMLDGRARTLSEIAVACGIPQQSASARLRDMRKISGGGYTVDRRHIGGGLYEYQVRMTPAGVPA